MHDRAVEISGTETHPHVARFQIGDQFVEAGLGFLGEHGGGFDGLDGGHGGVLAGFGEGVDVVEDVGLFGDV